jgi:hypothetical protein
MQKFSFGYLPTSHVPTDMTRSYRPHTQMLALDVPTDFTRTHADNMDLLIYMLLSVGVKPNLMESEPGPPTA